jgi:FkbM family methyltransferase
MYLQIEFDPAVHSPNTQKYLMKQAVIDFARKLRVYNLLRHNRVYHAVELLRKPDVSLALKYRIQQLHKFVGCRRFLAFDVGANIGQFTAPLLKLGARVVAVEPDPNAAAILRIRFWARWRITIEQFAISDQAGTANFYQQHPGSQRNTLQANEILSVGGASQILQVKLITLSKLIEKHGVPFFLKIDVEGHEFAVLTGLQAAVPRIMFECNTPAALQDGIRCVQRLHALSPNYVFALAEAGSVAPSAWFSQEELARQLEGTSRPVDIFARLP